MNRTLIITLVAVVVLFFLLRKKEMTRIEKIDWLNANVANNDGVWTKLTDDELKTVYKPFALVKQNVKPDEGEYLQALEVLRKYGAENLIL